MPRVKGYRAKMRRKADIIHARRFTLDWITATVDEVLMARDLPPLGGMRTDADTNTATDDGA